MDEPDCDSDGTAVGTASVRRVLGTLIIDGRCAMLHTEDGEAVTLADTPRGLASVMTQAGIPRPGCGRD
jgi:hypothetical protein